MAALFTIAKLWNQPKCPLIDEWIKRWGIYTMEYYSAINGILFSHKKRNISICNNMDVAREYNAKPKKDKYHVVSLTCGI